jgi:hypothetical protein
MMSIAFTCCFALIGQSGGALETVKLFDGHSLKGWTAMHGGKYEATTGSLVLDKGNGWLRSDGQYGDFDLTVEWRADARYRDKGGPYDSGLFFRTLGDEAPWPKNKYQMNMKQTTGGELSGIVKDGKVELLKPPGEWNTYRLRVKGNNAEAWINGQPAWKSDKIKTPKGYIGLQAEGYRIEFRRIELTPLG